MDMEKEFSAIEAIYKILEKIDDLGKKVQIIDDNIKILNNKVTKLNKNISNESTKQLPVATTTAQPNFSSDQMIDEQISIKEPEKLLLGPIKIFGYIMNKLRQPVDGVIVNIYDSNNKLVKANKTNIDGYWESRITHGAYNIEYIHSKFKPVNKEVSVPKNVREYEVK